MEQDVWNELLTHGSEPKSSLDRNTKTSSISNIEIPNISGVNRKLPDIVPVNQFEKMDWIHLKSSIHHLLCI